MDEIDVVRDGKVVTLTGNIIVGIPMNAGDRPVRLRLSAVLDKDFTVTITRRTAPPAEVERPKHFVIGNTSLDIGADLARAGWQEVIRNGVRMWRNPEGEIVQRATAPNQMQGWDRGTKLYIPACARSMPAADYGGFLQVAKLCGMEIVDVRDKVSS